MQNGTTSWLIRIGSFLLAGILLYLGLKGVDLNEVWLVLKGAQLAWFIPLIFLTILSHWLRALRWSLMLDVLPERANGTEKVSRFLTFLSVMIGYMANYAGPRLGEIIRTGYVARRERLHFSTVFGTVVVERTLDMVAFGIALLTVPLVFQNQLVDLWDLLMSPLSTLLEKTSSWVLGGITFGVVLVVGFMLIYLIRGIQDPRSIVARAASQFRDGMLSLLHTGKTRMLILHTVGMWMCYSMMAYIPFLLLGQADPFGIGLIQAWGIMLIGAFGVIIPSPGGIGTFHFVTIQALGLLFAMPQTEAASYAILAHSGQMILYLVIGFASFLYLGASLPAVTTEDTVAPNE